MFSGENFSKETINQKRRRRGGGADLPGRKRCSKINIFGSADSRRRIYGNYTFKGKGGNFGQVASSKRGGPKKTRKRWV